MRELLLTELRIESKKDPYGNIRIHISFNVDTIRGNKEQLEVTNDQIDSGNILGRGISWAHIGQARFGRNCKVIADRNAKTRHETAEKLKILIRTSPHTR